MHLVGILEQDLKSSRESKQVEGNCNGLQEGVISFPNIAPSIKKKNDGRQCNTSKENLLHGDEGLRKNV